VLIILLLVPVEVEHQQGQVAQVDLERGQVYP
jgi:hypothetical protein